MTPGNKRAAGTVPDGGFLGDARVAKTVELDEIFQALDPKTRKSFQTWQQDLSKAVAGRGRDLNDALGNLPAFADDGNDLLDRARRPGRAGLASWSAAPARSSAR